MDRDKYNDMIGSDYVCVYSNLFALTNVTCLNHAEVVLLGKIIALSQNKDKACTACNAYFEDFMRVKPRTIDKYLRELTDCGLITRYQDKASKYYTKVRYIRPQYDTICRLMADAGVQPCTDTPTDVQIQNAQTLQYNRTDVTDTVHERSQKSVQSCNHILDDKIKDDKIIDSPSSSPSSSSPSELLGNTTYTEELKLWNFKIKVIDLWSQDKLNNRDIADKLGVNINKINPIITEYVNNGRQYPIKPKMHLHDIYGNLTKFEPEDVLPFDQYSNKPIDISNINVLDLSEVYTFYSNIHPDDNDFIPLNKDELRQVYLNKYNIDVFAIADNTDKTNTDKTNNTVSDDTVSDDTPIYSNEQLSDVISDVFGDDDYVDTMLDGNY